VKEVPCSICGTVRQLHQNAREDDFVCSQLCRLIRNGELPPDAAERLPSQPCAACEKPVQMNRNFEQPRYCNEVCSRLAQRNRKMGRPENTPSTQPINHQERLRKAVSFWLPLHGIGTCAWCGDYFGRTYPDQRGHLGECSLRLRKASQPTEARHRVEGKQCPVCKESFETSDQRRKYCGKAICKARGRPWTPEGWKAGKASTDRYIARRRAAVETGDRTLTTLTIYLRDEGICQTCGIKTQHPQTPRARRGEKRYDWATLDHIKPLSQGGTHTWDNAQLLCLSCNSRKAHTDRKQLVQAF